MAAAIKLEGSNSTTSNIIAERLFGISDDDEFGASVYMYAMHGRTAPRQGTKWPRGYNLKDHLVSCSGGKLQLEAACRNNNSGCGGVEFIRNGVMEVAVDSIAGENLAKITFDALTAADQRLVGEGISLMHFSSIALVVPSNADWTCGFGEAAGIAIPETGLFVLRDDMVDMLQVAFHEYAHTLGLDHSGCLGLGCGALGDEYGDQSCAMGAGSGYSRLCFNGAQSKSLGWYEEDSVHLVPSLGHSYNGALIGVADWSSKNYEPGEQHVVVTISELRSNRRLHLLYNRAKGPNRDSWFANDKVTVTSDTGNGSKSLHKAALGGGQIFRVESFDGGSRDLIIKVAGMSELYPPGGEPDIAHVQVYLEGQVMPAFSKTPTGNYSDFISSHMTQHMLESMDF